MTTAVVEVGPQTVRGPGHAPRERVSAAIDCIDDQLALLDGELAEVARLWRDVLAAAAGDPAPRNVVLVVPTWWSSARIAVVRDAAADIPANIVVAQRSSVLGAGAESTVVELARDVVVVTPPGGEPSVLDRDRADVMAHLGAASSVLLDVPADVPPLPPTVTAALHAAGISVARSDRHRMLRAGAALPAAEPPESGVATARWNRRAVAVCAGAVLSAAAVGGGWAAQALSGGTASAPGSVVLVEGHVSVRVPAGWTVERITAGQGSARVRVSEPGGTAALHVTQSTATTPVTLADVGESLRRAIEAEPAGVFVDFDADGTAGGRPAVTYRERRADGETTWAVLVDGATRIAVGCHSGAAPARGVREACAQAVQSAHAAG
ncbi:type VII secretion-associated protein, Rv3446c family, C-terminal domain protein [Mycolicibacterium chubuense NBB4]|uniref:Type VII secretion-associated protein, Rv3446c family, C-terminal domain protein n=1 Tax=Mycolicibacterium chubuense (strain NBB4) TaxID=710421 RepID=I4BF06_MYCCN|nr:type VII secretion-associated protein [Mycolicibacterium chubuense]AFM15863.1 type VII secretion-associated protein, Rv3446c family, C-terminal domain protein [Mycolicibacterium chubuense NBB4]